MKIEISKLESLADEKLQIKVTGLKVYSKLKITAKAELPWCKGEKFSSYGIYSVGENGQVDLDVTKPDEGTYKKADSMGLIYSLTKYESAGKNIAENISIDNPFIIYMKFENENDQAEVKLQRIFKTEDVSILDIKEGFSGKLFKNPNASNKIILLITGSSGDVKALDLMAGPLASRGFNVLTVPYFNAPGLPDNLEEVPLEYFEKIFKWIKNNNVINKKAGEETEIYIHGTSKGAECALLLASRYKEVKKVAAIAAHGYCFQALSGMGVEKEVSSWSYGGKSIPYIKIDNDIFLKDFKICSEKGVPFGFASTYKKSIEKSLNQEEARIKLENAKADCLLVCGKEDNIWNSYDGCKMLVENLKKNNYKHKIEFLSYEHMGHPMPVPYIIPLSENTSMPMMGGIFSSGGTLEGNAEGQYDSWMKSIEFFS